MIANPPKQFFTPEEYLAWESEQKVRHEYINGEGYTMARGTLLQNNITDL
ncbi:MAG: hypothetical protein ACK40P_13085 [Pseudanabaena sp.]|jgi:Uma2 family endonuclease